MIRRFRELIFRQHNIGNWWGAFKNVAAGATMYITIINLLLLTVTAYGTTIAPWMQGKGLNIPFVAFLGIMFLGVMLVFAFEYKVSMPSLFSFWNDQWWKHDNPIRRRMDKMDKRLKKIEDVEKRLEAIEKAIGKLAGNGLPK